MSTVKAANLQNTGSGAPAFQNSSGTEIGQLCKAWVNFNGEGTIAIRGSFNVSSLTDNGTGFYTVSYTNAMANANYCFNAYGHIDNFSGSGIYAISTAASSVTTGSLSFRCYNHIPNNLTLRDTLYNCVSIFED